MSYRSETIAPKLQMLPPEFVSQRVFQPIKESHRLYTDSMHFACALLPNAYSDI